MRHKEKNQLNVTGRRLDGARAQLTTTFSLQPESFIESLTVLSQKDKQHLTISQKWLVRMNQ